MENTYLSNLTEYQKSLLTRLAYLNVDFYRFKNAKQSLNRIAISDLKQIILNPNETYLGSLHMPRLKRMVTNVNTTNLEFIDEIERAGLGNLEVVDFEDDKENGFNAICFRDSAQNIGFSFRGTDLKTFSSLAADGLADIEAFLTNNTSQIYKAERLFNRYKNEAGQNYLYGHSLGGFLVESLYLRNYENISNAFVINPLHINSELLDNQSKIDAFNNEEKFSCFVTGGDYVSAINSPDLFVDNIHYVKNSKETVNNPIGNHLIEAGEFDESGNFVECQKEEAFSGYTAQGLTDAIHFIKNENIKRFLSRAFTATKKYVSAIRRNFEKLLKKKEKYKEEEKQDSNRREPTEFEKYLDPNNYPKHKKESKRAEHTGNTKEEYER